MALTYFNVSAMTLTLQLLCVCFESVARLTASCRCASSFVVVLPRLLCSQCRTAFNPGAILLGVCLESCCCTAKIVQPPIHRLICSCHTNIYHTLFPCTVICYHFFLMHLMQECIHPSCSTTCQLHVMPDKLLVCPTKLAQDAVKAVFIHTTLKNERLFASQEAEIAKVLAVLLVAHFDPATLHRPRLRQCLSVFFPAYAAASSLHQHHLARAFRRAARGVLGVAPVKKAPAPQIMRYMLQVTHLTLTHVPSHNL